MLFPWQNTIAFVNLAKSYLFNQSKNPTGKRLPPQPDALQLIGLQWGVIPRPSQALQESRRRSCGQSSSIFNLSNLRIGETSFPENPEIFHPPSASCRKMSEAFFLRYKSRRSPRLWPGKSSNGSARCRSLRGVTLRVTSGSYGGFLKWGYRDAPKWMVYQGKPFQNC